MAHGTYCNSGTAWRDPTNKDNAICISIDTISASTEKTPATIVTPGLDKKTLSCTPDGETYCHYAKLKVKGDKAA